MDEPSLPQPMLDLIGFVRMIEPGGEWVRMHFEAREAHTHSGGTTVQGGILTAWLDHAMWRAVVARDPQASVASLEIKTSFMSRVGAGTHVVAARITKWGRQVVFMEAEVRDGTGRVLASATSCGMLSRNGC